MGGKKVSDSLMEEVAFSTNEEEEMKRHEERKQSCLRAQPAECRCVQAPDVLAEEHIVWCRWYTEMGEEMCGQPVRAIKSEGE